MLVSSALASLLLLVSENPPNNFRHDDSVAYPESAWRVGPWRFICQRDGEFTNRHIEACAGRIRKGGAELIFSRSAIWAMTDVSAVGCVSPGVIEIPLAELAADRPDRAAVLHAALDEAVRRSAPICPPARRLLGVHPDDGELEAMLAASEGLENLEPEEPRP